MKCPLTDRDIDSVNPFDVAVIHHLHRKKETVHDDDDEAIMCCLVPLISHLYSTSSSSIKDDPLLPKTVESIYDGISNTLLLREDSERNDNENYDVVSFKFNKHSYHLAVLKEKETNYYLSRIKSIFGVNGGGVGGALIETLAQDRIGKVLGMDSKRNTKVLYKGKVIYPNKGLSPKQISQKLIEISKSDQREKRRNPSLVVMGTRKGENMVQRQPNNHLGTVKQLRTILLSRYSCYLFLLGSGLIFFIKRIKTADQNSFQLPKGEL